MINLQQKEVKNLIEYEKDYDYNDHVEEVTLEKKEYFDKKDKKRKCDEVQIACGHVCDQCVDIFKCDKKCEVASLELDLRNFKRPIVKLDFSSNVLFRDLDINPENLISFLTSANASFTVQLYRESCCNKVCLGTWKFARYYNNAIVDIGAITLDDLGLFLASTVDTFGFTTCDAPICEECVLYTVVLKETTGLNVEIPFISKFIMTQIGFNAIVAEKH